MPNRPLQGPTPAALLRSRAEARLREQAPDLGGLSPDQIEEVLHELQVHQIELEMQNEHLRTTQAQLEKAREQYIGLYDFAPVGYLTISQQGLIMAANLTSVSLLGVERSRLISLAFSSFVLKDHQDTFHLYLRLAFNSSLRQSCEVPLHSAGGGTFFGRLELLQASDDGTPVCHVTVSDITEHKRAEEALRENERRQFEYENGERLRLAFDAGDLGAWDQEFRTGHIVCSDRACAMLGFTAGEPVKWQAFLECIHPDDRTDFLRAAEQSTQPGGTGRFDVVFRISRPGGVVGWLRFAARCFFEPGPAGQVIRRAGVLADITRQKETEELLESRAKHLEKLVRERTARLQEAVGELEHFSYTLAHDLRSPLRAMRGFSELLLSQLSDLSPVHRRYLERTSAAAERMDQLVQDALNYNKLERQNFILAPIDCGALLQELIESYPQFQEARAGIIITGPLPAVLGNHALLTQCFANLLNNALKFVSHGQAPSVRISAQNLAGRVRIWFQDNGIGIREDCQEIIFEMFQRLNHDYEGTGIGLALVKKAAERMRGAVGVESHPGQGSRFWLELNSAFQPSA